MIPSNISSATAALCGAFVALLGVLISAYWKNNHDTRLAREQREMALRKEVLLEITATLCASTNYLLAFARLDVSVEQVAKDNGIDSIQAAFGKMLLVATNETINAVSKANRYIAQAITNLATSRENVLGLKTLRDEAFAANPNSPVAAERHITFHEINLDHLELCFHYVHDVMPLISEAVICARRDLSSYETHAFDERRFRADQEANNQEALAHLLNFIKESRLIKDTPIEEGQEV